MLVVIAVAVAMLGVLVTQTTRQGADAPLVNAVGREGMLSERMVAQATAARATQREQRDQWRQRMRTTAGDWSRPSPRVDGTEVTRPAMVALRDEIIARAEVAASDSSSPSAIDSLVAANQRYVNAVDRIIDGIQDESSRRIDWLILVEAACVILLLTALGFGVRLALQPTQVRLQATVEALAESESRTRAMLDAMDEGMLLTEGSGRILAVNPSALRALGLDPAGADTTLQALLHQLVDERGEPMSLDRLPSRTTIRTGKSLTDVILGIRDAGGGVRWQRVNTHALSRGADENAYAVVSIFRDITIERRIEEERVAQADALELQNRELIEQANALARERALFRSLVDTAGISIVGLDMSGVVFEWNRETEVLYGVPRAEAIGRNYTEDFVSAKYRAQMYQGMAAVRAGKTLRNLIGPVRTPQGERHTVLWNIAPLRTGPDGPVHGMIAAGLDITEREASDERFRILFERSSDAHMLFDDERGVIDCNDATVRLLRYTSKEQVLGRRPKDLSPRRQPDGRLSLIVGEQMRQQARLRGYHRFQWAHLRADGSEFPVEVTITPIRLHGREVTLAVWHDITEQKQVEEALRTAKEAAESANRTKSEFMTRMNHELRTPLTAIIGFSRVLIQGREGALPEGAQRYVERIRVNGMHLLSLINQILDVAKVEAGRMELELDTVAVDLLVQETLGMLETTAEAKGLVLRSEVPPRVAPLVTDAGKLRQILINLVGNAVKFTNEGEVCVSVEVDPVSFRPVSVSVRDTGIGIPAERQGKVFDPFEQGDSSTRREFGGTGLGLSIVKTFAELIGARIEIESEVGTGTTFTLRLAPPAERPVGEWTKGERKAHST